MISESASTAAGDENTTETGSRSMGRYLEKDIALPEDCTMVETLQIQNDGTLALLYLDSSDRLCLSGSTDGGSSWETPALAAERMNLDSSTLVLILDGTVHYYDIRTGSPLDGQEALTKQITSREENLYLTSSSSTPILFTGGDEENSLFCVDRGGLYRYASGGSVVEQLIDGSLNSIGSPNIGFVSLTMDEEGSFYIAANDFSSGTLRGKLFLYTYSPDTPAVPDTELTVYSLEDNSFIRQAAAVFQKKYPDVYVNIECGMTGSDGITVTDALKTLTSPVVQNDIILNAVADAGARYLNGESSLEEAVEGIRQEISLYLAE